MISAVTIPRALGQQYKFQRLNPPGATFSSAAGLNNTGMVVGFFELAGGALQGFAYDGTGYRTISFPESTYTLATGVNDSGTVVGLFEGDDGFTHGYLLEGQQFTQYDVNNGVVSTFIYGINNAGNLVGFVGNDGANQGFVNIGGTLTQFTVNGNSTSAFGINSANEIVGEFVLPPPLITTHGFYRNASGKITLIDYPGAVGTACLGINDSSEITGYYVDTNNVPHGFLMKNGRFHASSLLPDLGQSNTEGSFVGYYFGKNVQSYGFLATPVSRTR